MERRAALASLALLIALGLGCHKSEPLPELPPDKPFPSASAAVAPLRAGGISWSNGEIRAYYLHLVSAIGPSDARWKQDGVPAAERARRAYQMRHDARVLCRAMMSAPADVAALEARDQAKYGHPDGPQFDELLAREKSKGLEGDAAFEAIVASAQRTDGSVNEMFNLGSR